MSEYILFFISIFIGSFYVWKILPHSFYEIIQIKGHANFSSIKLNSTDSRFKKLVLIIFGFLSALKYDRPAIELQESQLQKFSSFFKEPDRPIIDRRDLGDYYTGIPDFFKSLNQPNKTAITFRSRLAFIVFPLRFVIDHLISKPLTIIFLTIYLLGVFSFLGIIQLWSLLFRQKYQLNQAIDRKKAYFNECADYLNKKLPPWEFGFLLFKILEGAKFTEAIEKYGYSHPNCEFGIETALISTTHLQGVDYVDVGTEAIRQNIILGDIEYKQIINCYIEDNPFPEEAFKDIYLIHVVDHIPDLPKVIQELSRITKPGGHIFFSGLSDLMGGYYLEQLIYQGNIYNNKNIEWYENLVSKYGFKVKYKSYMQSGISYYFWRFTVFFHHRTEAWILFSKLYHDYPFIKILYKWIVDHVIVKIFNSDEFFVSQNKHGLNFMIVMQKNS